MQQRVLITGGAAGLGHALCGLFDGVLHSIDIAAPKHPHPHVHYHTLPVQSDEVESLLKEVGVVDLVINNAGMMCREGVREMSYDTAHKVFDVNVFGSWNVTRHAQLSAQGIVVFINSRHGHELRTNPAAYSLSKKMLSLLAESFAQEGIVVKQAFLGPFEGGVSRHGHTPEEYARRTKHSAQRIAELIVQLVDADGSTLVYSEKTHSYTIHI